MSATDGSNGKDGNRAASAANTGRPHSAHLPSRPAPPPPSQPASGGLPPPRPPPPQRQTSIGHQLPHNGDENNGICDVSSQVQRNVRSQSDAHARMLSLQQSAAEQNSRYAQSAQAAFRRGKKDTPTREVIIARDAQTPLGLSLNVVPSKSHTGSVVTVVQVESHGLAALAARKNINNSVFPGDRILFINGKDLLAVHHTMCLKLLEVEQVVLRIAIPDGFTTVQAMVAARTASNGGLVRPWTGPLARARSQEPVPVGTTRAAEAHAVSHTSLGRPGNPWANPSPNTDAPPSYEAAIHGGLHGGGSKGVYLSREIDSPSYNTAGVCKSMYCASFSKLLLTGCIYSSDIAHNQHYLHVIRNCHGQHFAHKFFIGFLQGWDNRWTIPVILWSMTFCAIFLFGPSCESHTLGCKHYSRLLRWWVPTNMFE
eukprot:m.280486 g.280486  ORF g.280486 m.280486 type:complete len:427 (-) comp19825_c0_seq6:1053-2333(-)